jgi:type I restriction enzyme R subunit
MGDAKKRIDPMLAAAGWLVQAFEPGKRLAGFTRHALAEFPTDNGPADYALFVAGQPFGSSSRPTKRCSSAGVLAT